MDTSDRQFQKNMMTSFIQIAAVVIIIGWCFSIIAPFINLVIWAGIIAAALYPLHLTLARRLGGRRKWSATLLTLALLVVLLAPAIYLADSSIDASRKLAGQLQSGTIVIPPPRESVAEWPVVGESAYRLWSDAAQNLEATLNKFEPQLRGAGKALVSFVAGSILGTLGFVISIIIAGVFMVTGEKSYGFFSAVGRTLSAEYGEELLDMSIATIRSVAKGVLGVAFIQALLSAVGLVVMDVPAPGLWTFLVLVLAIIQLPPLIVLGPIAVWVFSVTDGLPATVFAIYALVVSVSDSFLKPLLLGRGLDIPMLVILIGAIGGAMTSGIIGLFVGAVVLAVGYRILTAWIANAKPPATDEPVT